MPEFRGRQGRWEFMLSPQYVGSTSVDMGGGRRSKRYDLGFGFGFGYNFTGNLALHLNTPEQHELQSDDRHGQPDHQRAWYGDDLGNARHRHVAVDMTYYS